RDFEFARKFGLPIRRVVAAPGSEDDADRMTDAYLAHTEGEALVNSGRFSGMRADHGGRAVVEWLAGEHK
ncbi:MAG: hypothetical protein E6I45_06545, partial [Chloroflexi bacterium]